MPTPGPRDQTAPPPAVADLLRRAASPGFDAWQRRIVRLGGCTNPIHLHGTAHTVDAASGEILHTHSTDDGPLLIPCGNRRSAVCPTCSTLYKGDTYQLIRAGLVGGKQTPDTVTGHPRVFATFTAPGFGAVHTRRDQTLCRPRRGQRAASTAARWAAGSATPRTTRASASPCARTATTTRARCSGRRTPGSSGTGSPSRCGGNSPASAG